MTLNNWTETMRDCHFDDMETYLKSKTYKDVCKMQEEYFSIVRKTGKDYVAVEVPEDFTVEYAKPKISQEIKNTTIPVKLEGSYGKTRIKVVDLINFKGIVFFGSTDEQRELSNAYEMFRALYGSDHIATSYSTYNGTFSGSKNGVVFVSMAKNKILQTTPSGFLDSRRG